MSNPLSQSDPPQAGGQSWGQHQRVPTPPAASYPGRLRRATTRRSATRRSG